MRSQYTSIHIEIVLNVCTFILQYFFSGWGNKCRLKKICTTFDSGIHPLFDFYIDILSAGTNEFFLPNRLKKIQSSLPALILISKAKLFDGLISFRYFCRGSHEEHSWEVWLQLANWYRSRCRQKKIVDDARRRQKTDID